MILMSKRADESGRSSTGCPLARFALKHASKGVILRRHVGAWRSLVARFVWDEEVAGSNPVAPTIRPRAQPVLQGSTDSD